MKIHHFIYALFLAAGIGGCVSTTTMIKPVPDAGDIRPGMTEEAVVERLGEPQLVDPYQVGKYIFFYPKSTSADCISNPAACTPVVFAEGRVVGIGHRYLSNAGDGPDRGSVPAAKKPARIDEKTRREIERLERQVRQIPAARTMDNLRIYRYLLKLDPDSSRYRQKVARYEAQYRREQDRREELRREREERRKRENKLLRRFEGNDRIQIAVENQGNGRFYVWIKYSGMEPIEIQPEDFSLVCRNGGRYSCYRCRDLAVSLKPGERAEGRLSFATYADPRELVFSHPAAGKVTRVFPDQ